MVDFSAGYVPPGVYVQTQTTGNTGVVGIGNTVCCIVGRGRGYQVNTETISFASGNTVQLTQTGIDASDAALGLVPGTPTFVVTGYVAGVLTTFVPDGTSTPHDFSVTQTNPGQPDNVVSIVRTSSGTIPTTGNITVSYHYTPATYYEVNAFTDYASLATIYGPSLDPVTGAVVSPVTLAAQVAFQNGANKLYVVALNTGNTATVTPAEFETAYQATLPFFDINLMVPLFEDAVDAGSAETELTQLSTFLAFAESQSVPRMAIVGLPQTFTGTSPDTLAAATNYKRIVLSWPQTLNFFNPYTNKTTTLDGFYAAAAEAGYLANGDPDQPLTRAQIKGFTGLPLSAQATLTNRNLWSSRGVTVLEVNRLGQLIVRHGVTTDVSNVGTREISIIRCQDALLELLQVTLDSAQLIGSPITVETPLQIKSLVAGALETALSNNTIQAYQNLLVTQESLPTGDPTIVAVTFDYFPTYPLNYITVTFTLNLSTGSLQSSVSTDTTSGGQGSTSSLVNIGGI